MRMTPHSAGSCYPWHQITNNDDSSGGMTAHEFN